MLHSQHKLMAKSTFVFFFIFFIYFFLHLTISYCNSWLQSLVLFLGGWYIHTKLCGPFLSCAKNERVGRYAGRQAGRPSNHFTRSEQNDWMVLLRAVQPGTSFFSSLFFFFFFFFVRAFDCCQDVERFSTTTKKGLQNNLPAPALHILNNANHQAFNFTSALPDWIAE